MRKGFTQVDGQGDPGKLIAGMEATAQWPAVKRLRAWEIDRLALQPGDAVLDVGCGPGDVTVALAALVGATGRAVGIDASGHMIAAASARAEAAHAQVELARGDAAALDFADGTFTAVRCERTLQWVPNPATAIAEFVRVTRPGGRVSVIDTDWRTLLIDHPSPALVRRFGDAMAAVRGEQLSIGARLTNLAREAGLTDVRATAETHIWLEWDPDMSIAPPGMFPLRMIADELIAHGDLDPADAQQLLDEFEQTARNGRVFVSLTMFGSAGVKRM